jgi:hypothetical protein
MIAHLKLDDRLSVLRAEDRFRNWSSLDDERLCVVCKRKFSGRQVEIRRLAKRKYELRCPTDGCDSVPHLWIYPTTPLVAYMLELDWYRVAGREHRSSGSKARAENHRI